jgi:hypothetical protein
MHLCDIPTNQIHQVEIPTGLPLVYDHKLKRVKLLEDVNESQSLFTKYNFGDSPDLLFKPKSMCAEEFKQVISDVGKSQYGSLDENRERVTSHYDPIIRLRQR